MPFIYQLNNKDQVLEPRLQIGNEEIVRPLNLALAGFTGFRVGIRYAVHGIGLVKFAGLHIGVMQNSAFSHRTSSCVEFLGAHQGSAAVTGIDNGDFTYTGSTTNPYYATTTGRPYSRVGSLVTVFGSQSTATIVGAIYPVCAPMMFMAEFDITATSTTTTTYSITLFQNTGAPSVFMSHADFLYNMEAPSSFKNSLTATSAITGAVHPGLSLFDTAVFSWNKATPPLDVFDFAVYRNS